MKGLMTIAAAASALALPFAAFADTSTGTATIALYVNGQHATASSTAGMSIPMLAIWSAKNIGHSNGAYPLSTVGFNTSTPYEAVTADMSLPYSYETRADVSWDKVNHGAISGNCRTGDPFALDGYSVGDSLSAAESAGASTTANWATTYHAASSTYMIVWAHHCLAAPSVTYPNNGTSTTTAGLTHIDWSPVTDSWGTVQYIYQSATMTGTSTPPATNADGSYSSPAYTSGPLSDTTIATGGTPPGTYYVHVKAVDSTGSESWWSNPIKVKVTANP